VDAAALLGEPNDRGYSCESFAFASLHFRDLALRQGKRSQELDIEHLKSNGAARYFGGQGDDFPQVVSPPGGGLQCIVAAFGQLSAASVDSADRRFDGIGNGGLGTKKPK
jgi:hypothetical protein